jgi:hypothetical protein
LKNTVFWTQNKAKPVPSALYISMRKLRILAADAWYHVSTAVNNREPLFWVARERARFEQVLNEAREIYVFELRGLRFCGSWASFYIKPADGFELPAIMQWVKQTYAVRYNVYDGRTGHIWGTGTGRRLWTGRRKMRRSMCSWRWCAGGRGGGGLRRVAWEDAGNAVPRRAARHRTRRADPGRGGGRLNLLRSPICPDAPPIHTANRSG